MNRLSVRTLLWGGLMLLAPASAQAPLSFPVQTRDRLSQGREFVAAATVGSETLFAGGNNSAGPSDVVDIYDASSGQWSTTTLTVARLGHAGTAVGTRALFAGGLDFAGTVLDVVEIYDGASGSWAVDQLSTPRLFPAAASQGSLAFFGGGAPAWPPSSSSDVVDVLDTTTNSWFSETLSEPRVFLAAASAGQKVLFAGGIDYSTGVVHDTVDIYDASVGPPDDPNAWSATTLPIPRYLLVATAVGSKILFAGGLDQSDVASDVVDIYDTATGIWTQAKLSQARCWLAATTVGDKARFAGGYSVFGGPGTVFDTVDVYDDSTDTWSQEALFQARARPIGATVRGQAMFAGGVQPGGYSYVVDRFDG